MVLLSQRIFILKTFINKIISRDRPKNKVDVRNTFKKSISLHTNSIAAAKKLSLIQKWKKYGTRIKFGVDNLFCVYIFFSLFISIKLEQNKKKKTTAPTTSIVDEKFVNRNIAFSDFSGGYGNGWEIIIGLYFILIQWCFGV